MLGVGFGGGDVVGGTTLAVGIGLLNAPEGLPVALALFSCGYPRAYAFVISTLTGLVEPIAGLFGAYVVSLPELIVPWALTFAAGAMLYVIIHDFIPETHQHRFENEATFGITIGLVLMMFLDVVFG